MAVLPIITVNNDVLRKQTEAVTENSEELQNLIDDMFETMYEAHGIGLAAPQIGKSISLFVIDPDGMLEDDEEKPGKMVFINPEIVEKGDEIVEIEEGCLSIPDIRESVKRPVRVVMKYLDRDFNEQKLDAEGWLSRVIQHEFDHLQGVLFIDYLGSFRKRLLKGRLDDIDKGRYLPDYEVVPNH